MHATGRTITNTNCGTVNYLGEVMSGCGRAPGPEGHREYMTKVEGYLSLWSMVCFCKNCEPKEQEK